MILVVGVKQRSSPVCYWRTERDRSRAICFLAFYAKSWTNLQFKCDDAAKQTTTPSCYAVLDAPSCGQFSALVCVLDASCQLKDKVFVGNNSTNGLKVRNLGAFEVERERRERGCDEAGIRHLAPCKDSPLRAPETRGDPDFLPQTL